MAVIPYSDVLDTRLLPIDAQDIVTKVILVVAGNRAGAEPDVHYVSRLSADTPGATDGSRYDITANPIVYEYEAPEHATLGCARAFALPEGIDPFLPPEDDGVGEPTSVSGFTNPGSPSAIRDGDPATYAEVAGAGHISYSNVANLAGFRLRYKATNNGGPPRFGMQASIRNRRGGSDSLSYSTYATFKLTSDEVTDLYLVMPPDARNADENDANFAGLTYRGSTSLTTFANTGEARVHHFYPLILNEALLEDIAKSNIRLPAQLPQRVTVRGYVAPDREHTIQGWPGGDYTGVVAQHQYELGRTAIDFEESGPPLGVPAEAVEAERVRVARTTASIDRAAYGLKMGERQ